MRRKKLQKIVDKHIVAMCENLNLGDWDITYSCEKRSDSNACATCRAMRPYNKAYIVFYAKQLSNKADVLSAMRHELLHVVLSDVELLVDAVDNSATKKSAPVHEIVQHYAIEQQLRTVEALLDYNGLTPRKLIQ